MTVRRKIAGAVPFERMQRHAKQLLGARRVGDS